MRILKRKGYYYLQHSFRKEGKVITREIYIGDRLPKDIKEIKERFLQKYVKSILNKQFEQIKVNFQQDWNKIPESVKAKELQEVAIAFTYNTNAIEGSKITLPETRAILQEKIAPNKSLYDIKETEAHSRVFLAMLQEESITEQLVLHWHREIFRETKKEIAGRYRDYRVRVGIHIPPDWQDVPELMRKLITSLKHNHTINPVEFAARIHYQFEFIHPFGDGNGRIGRLLMNQILWHAGYPILVIENKKRLAYYKALEKGEEKFTQYLFRTYLKAHKRYLKGTNSPVLWGV